MDLNEISGGKGRDTRRPLPHGRPRGRTLDNRRHVASAVADRPEPALAGPSHVCRLPVPDDGVAVRGVEDVSPAHPTITDGEFDVAAAVEAIQKLSAVVGAVHYVNEPA